MNAVPYSHLLEAACDYAGLARYTSSGATAQQNDLDKLRMGISLGLAQYLAIGAVPEWERSELRRFRAAWSSTTTYAAGAEVFHIPQGKYVQALFASLNVEPYDSAGTLSQYWAESATSYSGPDWTTSTTLAITGNIYRYPVNGRFYALHTAAPTGTLPTNGSYFGLLTPFDPYISPTQTGETVIGEVVCVTDSDTMKSTQWTHYPHFVSSNGIQVPKWPTEVWVRFKLRPPRLVGALLDLTAAYAAGEQVYYQTTTHGVTTGDFYDIYSATTAGMTPDNYSVRFTKIEIPARLEDRLAHLAAAHWLATQGDGRAAEAAMHRQMAALFDFHSQKNLRNQGN